jgi:Na+/H+ antiporter NhaD/arsenite permease-like protein
MNSELLLVVGLLVLCIGLFVINKPRMDVVALLAIVVLPLCGLVTVPEALTGFSDPNIILIAALFVIGEGLVRTGIASKLGEWLVSKAGGDENRLLLLLMLAVGGLGAVMSSTGVVAIFIPVVLGVSERMSVPAGRLMMPLSFAGLISGMLTLVATSALIGRLSSTFHYAVAESLGSSVPQFRKSRIELECLRLTNCDLREIFVGRIQDEIAL